MTAEDRPDDAPPGRPLTGRSATLVVVVLGLALAALAATALVTGSTTGGDGGGSGEADHDEHDHVEAPLEVTDPTAPGEQVDSGEFGDSGPCADRPGMCGEGVGTGGPCDDPDMCGPIAPAPGGQDIDPADGSCKGELCGDIGPGVDDGTEA